MYRINHHRCRVHGVGVIEFVRFTDSNTFPEKNLNDCKLFITLFCHFQFPLHDE